MGFSVKKISDVTVNDKKSKTTIKGDELHQAALTIRALNHSLRKAIVDLVNQKGEVTVTEIFVELRTEQSVASQHLAILREAKWLSTRRDGKFIYYSVNHERFNQIANIIGELQ